MMVWDTIINKGAQTMMFLIRTAFWLMIVILLLPTDEQQQSQVFGTAQAAVKDVTAFCDRNPEACAKGQDAFSVLVHKAQFGARMLMGILKEQTAGNGEETASAGAEPDAAQGQAPWDATASQDTLESEDRATAWEGPDASGT